MTMPERAGYEVGYDASGNVQVIEGERRVYTGPYAPETLGCHSGSEMEAAARIAGKSDILDQYANPDNPRAHEETTAREIL